MWWSFYIKRICWRLLHGQEVTTSLNIFTSVCVVSLVDPAPLVLSILLFLDSADMVDGHLVPVHELNLRMPLLIQSSSGRYEPTRRTWTASRLTMTLPNDLVKNMITISRSCSWRWFKRLWRLMEGNVLLWVIGVKVLFTCRSSRRYSRIPWWWRECMLLFILSRSWNQIHSWLHLQPTWGWWLSVPSRIGRSTKLKIYGNYLSRRSTRLWSSRIGWSRSLELNLELHHHHLRLEVIIAEILQHHLYLQDKMILLRSLKFWRYLKIDDLQILLEMESMKMTNLNNLTDLKEKLKKKNLNPVTLLDSWGQFGLTTTWDEFYRSYHNWLQQVTTWKRKDFYLDYMRGYGIALSTTTWTCCDVVEWTSMFLIWQKKLFRSAIYVGSLFDYHIDLRCELVELFHLEIRCRLTCSSWTTSPTCSWSTRRLGSRCAEFYLDKIPSTLWKLWWSHGYTCSDPLQESWWINRFPWCLTNLEWSLSGWISPEFQKVRHLELQQINILELELLNDMFNWWSSPCWSCRLRCLDKELLWRMTRWPVKQLWLITSP